MHVDVHEAGQHRQTGGGDIPNRWPYVGAHGCDAPTLEADVTRLPDTVGVQLRERRPIVVWRAGEDRWYVDDSGMLFAAAPGLFRRLVWVAGSARKDYGEVPWRYSARTARADAARDRV